MRRRLPLMLLLLHSAAKSRWVWQFQCYLQFRCAGASPVSVSFFVSASFSSWIPPLTVAAEAAASRLAMVVVDPSAPGLELKHRNCPRRLPFFLGRKQQRQRWQ